MTVTFRLDSVLIFAQALPASSSNVDVEALIFWLHWYCQGSIQQISIQEFQLLTLLPKGIAAWQLGSFLPVKPSDIVDLTAVLDLWTLNLILHLIYYFLVVNQSFSYSRVYFNTACRETRWLWSITVAKSGHTARSRGFALQMDMAFLGLFWRSSGKNDMLAGITLILFAAK